MSVGRVFSVGWYGGCLSFDILPKPHWYFNDIGQVSIECRYMTDHHSTDVRPLIDQQSARDRPLYLLSVDWVSTPEWYAWYDLIEEWEDILKDFKWTGLNVLAMQSIYRTHFHAHWWGLCTVLKTLLHWPFYKTCVEVAGTWNDNVVITTGVQGEFLLCWWYWIIHFMKVEDWKKM